jgi:hypothetical protein
VVAEWNAWRAWPGPIRSRAQAAPPGAARSEPKASGVKRENPAHPTAQAPREPPRYLTKSARRLYRHALSS